MKIGSQRDFVSGLLFVITGAGFAVGATHYHFGSSANPGPGFFPLWLGLGMVLLGAVVAVQALGKERHEGDPIGAIAWRPLLVILASVIVFGLALPKLGLVVAVPLLVVGSSLAGAHFRLVPTLVLAAVLTLGCWLVFVKGLSLTLPVLPVLGQ